MMPRFKEWGEALVKQTIKHLLIGECKIIVPLRDTRDMPFWDAARKASDYTNRKRVEVGFEYDPETGLLLSPIYAGSECRIQTHPPGGIHRKETHGIGDFHTHPGTYIEACNFSPDDALRVDDPPYKEMAVACPSLNELLTSRAPGSLPPIERKQVREQLFQLHRKADDFEAHLQAGKKSEAERLYNEIVQAMEQLLAPLGLRRWPLRGIISPVGQHTLEEYARGKR